MFAPVEEIGNAWVVFLANVKRVARLALIVEIREHIDSDAEPVLVLLNIIWQNWIWETVEIVPFKKRIVKHCSSEMSIEINWPFNKIEQSVAKATVIAIVDIHNGLLLLQILGSSL